MIEQNVANIIGRALIGRGIPGHVVEWYTVSNVTMFRMSRFFQYPNRVLSDIANETKATVCQLDSWLVLVWEDNERYDNLVYNAGNGQGFVIPERK